MDNWISVTDRLPEKAGKYIVCRQFHNGQCGVGADAFLLGAEKPRWKADFVIGGGKVTHWMPLPEPPTMGKE